MAFIPSSRLGGTVLEAVGLARANGEMRVQYADKAVVVIKPKPKKASNRLEDKT